MEVCRALYAENAIFKMDDEKVRHFIRRAFVGDGAVAGVIGSHDHIEAAIYLLIGEFWYSSEKHLEEFFNYVRPEHRKSKHAQKLIEFAKTLSNQTPLPLFIGVLSSKRTEAKVKLYERQLGKPAGAFFVFNRAHAGGPAAAAA